MAHLSIASGFSVRHRTRPTAHRRAIAGYLAYGARLFLGVIFLCGGLSKLMDFPGVMGPTWLEDRLAPYELAMYARFIAWSEAAIGAMLLSRPLSTLGAIMLVPLVLNILMVTISMRWQGTPYVVGVFLLMNLYLLAYDFDKWKRVIGLTRSSRDNGDPTPGRRVVVVSLLSVVALLASPLVYPRSDSIAYLLAGIALAFLFTEPIVVRARLRNARAVSAPPPQLPTGSEY